MATTPTPQPDQGQGAAPPPPGAGGPPPPQNAQQPPPDQSQQQQPDQSQQSQFQAPANQFQILLARWSEAAKQMATSDPRLAAGAQKVREGIRDMQQAMITPQPPTPLSQQPQV